jgi:type I restriction enzyme M protein
MARAKKTKTTKTNGGPIGYEAQLWKAADALRSNMDAAECEHVVLGLISFRHIAASAW